MATQQVESQLQLMQAAGKAWQFRCASGEALIFKNNTDEKVRYTPDGFIEAQGGFSAHELSADPTEPGEGECVIWLSDGTGKGDDGDVLIASKAGGTTKWGTLFDHSAGAAW